MPSKEFYCYRRAMPHWRLEGAIYFITWRLLPSQSDLTGPERDIVVSVLTHFDTLRYRLHGYVVMNDHVHVLVEPFKEHPLEVLLGAWKGYSSKLLVKEAQRGNRVWQHDSFDRIIRDTADLEQKLAYIQGNPFKRWPDLTTYPWLSPLEDERPRSSGGEAAPSRTGHRLPTHAG